MTTLSPASLRRFTEHAKPGNPLVLAEDHPAVVDGRSRYRQGATASRRTDRALLSGHNQRKIGKRVEKGRWHGMPIYTLTLEERATCPRTCGQWRSCYGNRMPWPVRLGHGPELEERLERELAELQRQHPRGFVIRLHILGDFYSQAYVRRWEEWLDRFPALRVFGYTARDVRGPIGRRLGGLIRRRWERFAVRSSGGGLPGVPASRVVRSAAESEGAILCPAQSDRTACCGTCGLCWSTRRAIAFLEH